MTGETSPPAWPSSPPPRRSTRWLLISAAVAFALGLLAMWQLGPVIERWRAAPQPQQAVAEPQQPVAPARIVTAVPITLEGLAAREAAIDAQLNVIEARLADADASSRVSAGNATRAEALAVALAARRQIARGLPLGPLQTELRTRFGGVDPAAVATVTGASAITLEDLRQALDRIAPELTSGGLREGLWPAIRRSVSSLVQIRRESTPSARPADRLQRAQRLLDAGQVEGALAEVARMPGASAATSWLDAAKRYVEVRQALDRLELAALQGRAAASLLPRRSPAPSTPNPLGAPNPAG
jgi:hypothetical protein